MNRNEYGRKSKHEKFGFYIALSVCLVAVGLAAWSTFDSVSKYMRSDETEATVTATLAPVDKNMSGITEPVTTVPKVDHHEDYTVVPTDPTESTNKAANATNATEAADPTESTEATGETEDAVQTLLRVTQSLKYPISGELVIREYSESAVRNETMNDLRPHMGVDFGGESGEEVVSMCDGVVKDIYKDEMLGNVLVVENDELTVYYCGLEDITVERGGELSAGNAIGTVGTVPFEEKDEPHIHVSIIVNNRYIDPISIIENNQ